MSPVHSDQGQDAASCGVGKPRTSERKRLRGRQAQLRPQLARRCVFRSAHVSFPPSHYHRVAEYGWRAGTVWLPWGCCNSAEVAASRGREHEMDVAADSASLFVVQVKPDCPATARGGKGRWELRKAAVWFGKSSLQGNKAQLKAFSSAAPSSQLSRCPDDAPSLAGRAGFGQAGFERGAAKLADRNSVFCLCLALDMESVLGPRRSACSSNIEPSLFNPFSSMWTGLVGNAAGRWGGATTRFSGVDGTRPGGVAPQWAPPGSAGARPGATRDALQLAR
ncbi:hypothetical protein GGTG_06490 [Gaeumannomyces tritici R3-111a-1]|uniref:Uncharacterized protein n=1 Tax=Gaeumannomyces tritici (strain R3-111a-1) TaxID=644352 RepID=J3NYY9_GAET3|nr:hypothetical protein GGTG_06490 [Gaeumannomyces tritici R3-111a-1]EJT76572.1 hypothetical protein GGTG_06490 [Gaeumannomyces tritici R3-111a-1]